MMNDKELARRLGHFDVNVIQGIDSRYYASCSCRWKIRRELESAAIEGAAAHIQGAADRFRAEAARAGLSVTEALARWNGRWRSVVTGLLEPVQKKPR